MLPLMLSPFTMSVYSEQSIPLSSKTGQYRENHFSRFYQSRFDHKVTFEKRCKNLGYHCTKYLTVPKTANGCTLSIQVIFGK